MDRGRIFGLFIGVDHYQSSVIRPLEFAAADAVGVRDLVADRCGCREEDLIELIQGPGGIGPIRRDIFHALNQLSSAPMGPQDSFFLFFAGHGFWSGTKGFLAAWDTEPDSEEMLEETAVSLGSLQRFLRRIGAGQKIIVLDACRNNPFGDRRGGHDGSMDSAMARDLGAIAHQAVGGVGQRVAVLSSCWEGQEAHEYREGKHGWYCWNLLEELAAFPGTSLSVADLHGRVRDRMTAESWKRCSAASRQLPHLVVEGDIPIIPLAQKAGMAGAPPQRRDEPRAEPLITVTKLNPLSGEHAYEAAVLGFLREGLEPAQVRERLEECRLKAGLTVRIALEIEAACQKFAPNPSPPKSPGARLRLPSDLHAITAAKLAVTGGLAIGSQEAQARQRGFCEQHGLPLEVENELGMRFRLIPPGRFQMGEAGCEDGEGPQHQVEIGHPVWVGVYPVTQQEWEAVMGSNPSRFKEAGRKCPVETVSWDDCQAFLVRLGRILSLETGIYRLLSEAEWEYACRAGTQSPFYFGSSLTEDLACINSSQTKPVGTFPSNGWGLHDMHGNVWEWVEDDGHDSYRGAPANGSAWVDQPRSARRVLRGGSWAAVPRSAARRPGAGTTPTFATATGGLRLARTLPVPH